MKVIPKKPYKNIYLLKDKILLTYTKNVVQLFKTIVGKYPRAAKPQEKTRLQARKRQLVKIF